MSTSEHVPGSFVTLSDSELQVLRLLAAGHTVKSIAAALNRSEASINERLRDARRKSGIGSSRELARMIDAQKIWDKNSDLSTQAMPPQVRQGPPESGSAKLKGSHIMLASLPIFAAALALATGQWTDRTGASHPAEATVAQRAPLEGRWSLDIMGIPEAERPQSVTIEFRQAADRRWTTVVQMVGPDGVRRHAESTAFADGVYVPVSGNMTFIDSASLRRPDTNTLVMSLAKDGAPVSTRVYTTSSDGLTMTETIIWPGPAVPGLETTTFIRQDP